MPMDLQTLESSALKELEGASSSATLEAVYTRYLGRKDGELTNILKSLASLTPEEKKKLGQQANEVRTKLEQFFSQKKNILEQANLEKSLQDQKIDLSLPGTPFQRGKTHPILQTINEISGIFSSLGFQAVEGPEIEVDKYNFTDLNIPLTHPARDMHDTFYIDSPAPYNPQESLGPSLLRTHTSPVQIRVMKSMKPPIRIISPGRVFRHEATDATHAAIFHQIEGLAIDENLSFADLKGVLTYFSTQFFGADTKVRFMPSYFPFVEPGAQMDVQCFSCKGSKVNEKGEPCGLCKATGWIEMLGAGMVHPQVLRNVGFDPKKYSGYAFGMGVERILMTRSQIRDIRLFLESDLRFLEQF